MKKLLSALGVITILGSSIPNVIANDCYHKTVTQNKRSIELWIIRRIQETNWFCVPTSMQMIFGYFNIARRQTVIYNDLNGVGENGLVINQNLVNYLNNNIRPVNQTINYDLVQMNANFGHTSAEQLLFQNYVYQSLFNNYPVLFGYADQNDGHAILITGININENNPGETQYTYLDPTDGAQMTFLGREISNYIHIDGELVGFGAEPDFNKNVLQVVVENEEIDKNDISDNENHEVVRMQLDLTATTGATKIGQIHDAYQKLTLNEFNGEIYLFTRKKSVTDFSVNFNHLPNNADKWVSPIIEIERAIEEIGGAHIDGHISVQVIFSHSRINHLILTLIIYVGGQSWSTRNWPHIWFMTGQILSFYKK